MCVCVCGKVSDTSTYHAQWRGGGVGIGWGNSKWSTGEEGGGESVRGGGALRKTMGGIRCMVGMQLSDVVLLVLSVEGRVWWLFGVVPGFAIMLLKRQFKHPVVIFSPSSNSGVMGCPVMINFGSQLIILAKLRDFHVPQ